MNRKQSITWCIFFSLFILGTILIFITPTSVKVTYGLTAQTDDDVTIYFNVYEPVNGDKKMKAMILGHGGSANKEFLKGYAIEMAAAGFVVATLDFRGHGQSTGELDNDKLDKDVKAIKKYLEDRNDIDMDKLGYLGYSMGGGPGNKVVKADDDFKCLILVGSGLKIEKNDIAANRSLNVLIIQARYDEAHTLAEGKEEMGKWLGKESKDVDFNKLYGNFTANASKIYLDDNSDHLTLSWDPDFIREARNWVINTFDDVKAPDEDYYVHFRFLILVMQVAGGLGVFFLSIKPLSNLLVRPREEEIVKIEVSNETVSSLSKKSLLYTLVLGIPGIIIAFGIAFLPLKLAGLLSMLLFGHAFGLLLMFRSIAKRTDSSVKEYLKKPFKISRDLLLRNIVLGVLLGIFLYIIIILTFGLNYIGMIPSIFKLPWVPIYFAILVLIMTIFAIFSQLILQPKLENKDKGLIKTGVLGFLIQIIYLYTFVLGFCIIRGNYFYVIFLIISTPVTLLCSFVLVYTYKNSGNIIAGIIITTLIITCLLCTLAPFSFSISYIFRRL